MKVYRNKLTIKIITLFPEFINSFSESFGILKKAIKNNLLEIKPVNLRKFGLGERQVVDDRPYGGGVGMVLRPDVLYKAIRFACRGSHWLPGKRRPMAAPTRKQRIILLTPQGKRFAQKDAARLSKYDQLIFVSGRYEGFDERIRKFADEEISIGDYVLMGGELPALVISEAVMRLRPGILGKIESTHNESFSENILEYPQYTKPEVLEISIPDVGAAFRRLLSDGGRLKLAPTKKKAQHLRVPKVLLSGNHQKVDEWRMQEAVKRTKKRRPDLLVMTKMNKN
ncbi:MAG: tRNA (guanosine(37)-N1)-methyltransferase TrmD [Patescibacteria group bacterium]|nr:tRNA (guanosine(37)-N1)-methyltransferase TrmD [Patescibacteria group bacterium]